MPLVSEEPHEVGLPALRLVGTLSLVDFRESQDPAVFAETWTRFFPHMETLAEARTEPTRTFGLNVFPPDFPADMRWYYGACAEVDTLERDYSTALMARYVPAANYLAFTVEGPIAEIAPAYDRAWELVAKLCGGKPKCSVNLELYDERYTSPDDPASRMDLLFPVPPTS